MENLSINRARRISVLFTLCMLCLYGCKSTTEKDPDANCRADTKENCTVEDGNGEDRGYNPCLVNKNLPVCSK